MFVFYHRRSSDRFGADTWDNCSLHKTLLSEIYQRNNDFFNCVLNFYNWGSFFSTDVDYLYFKLMFRFKINVFCFYVEVKKVQVIRLYVAAGNIRMDNIFCQANFKTYLKEWLASCLIYYLLRLIAICRSKTCSIC